MSLTNDTILLWTLYDDVYNNATHIDFYITMVATSIFLLIFARLVWNDRNSHTQKSVFTSFNVLLFSMIMCNALALIFQFIYDESTVPLFVNIYISISYFFICSFQFLVIFYTWNRGSPVIQTIAPKLCPYFTVVLILFGLLEASQFIWFVLDNVAVNDENIASQQVLFNEVLNGHTIATNVFMCVFDVIIATFYALYLRSVRSLGLNVNKLVILSRYGVASFITLEVWLNFVVAYTIWANAASPTVSLATYSAGIHISDIGQLLYILIQLAMKRALQKEDERARQSLQRNAAGVSDKSETVKGVESNQVK